MSTITIGRNLSNDFIIDNESVSRFHSELQIDRSGKITYVDHSANGTVINGMLIHNSQCSLTGHETVYLAGKVSLNIQDVIRKHRSVKSTIMMPNNPTRPEAPIYGNQNYGNQNYGNQNYGSQSYESQFQGYGNNSNKANPAMGFGKTFQHFFKHYADFSGRARRSEYWYMVLWNLIFCVIPIVNILWALAVMIPFLALAVRRLHDTGKSGAWILICLIPFIGSILILIWMLTDSEPNPNKWGKSPKYNR